MNFCEQFLMANYESMMHIGVLIPIITNIYVTVNAKTSQVHIKIEIHFLPLLIATHISYLHSMSPMARLN